MPENDPRALSTQRRRRGVVKASITRLSSRVEELESRVGQPDTNGHAQRLATRLETLDAEFRTHHFSLIDIVDDDETLEKEQEVLDQHDDDVTTLAVRVQQLLTLSSTPSTNSDSRKILTRKLRHLERSLSLVGKAVSSLSGCSGDVCRLQQHEEQLSDYRKDLADFRDGLLSLDLREGDELLELHASLEKRIFDFSLQIKELLRPHAHAREPTPASTHSNSDGRGVKLPKLDVPTFDGNILKWQCFWEQFCVSVHSRSSLSDSEKLVYLQHALKDGSAKHVIEGLSRSGEHYAEAVKCLTSRYDRPRLIHQTHVKMILEASPLKEGTGKELRRLHDTVQQHLRALKAMDYDPSGPFITSTLELKLDTNTMFEWQKHSQSSNAVPHYQDLLEFINLRAQASEASIADPAKKHTTKHDFSSSRKPFISSKPVVSFAANTDSNLCVACEMEKHPLYVCTKFKLMSHDKKVSLLKMNGICMNCLGSGHFVRQCKSLHRCKECQKPHHTLLHEESRHETRPIVSPTGTTGKSVVSNTAVGLKTNALLMTCRVLVSAPDGSSVAARAILDSASSASFISERLAQSLCLPRSKQNARILGIAGISHKPPIQSVTSFSISAVQSSSKRIDVTAIIVPRVTCDLPLHPISFDLKWDHLSSLQLADPTFSQPGRIDILLGVDVFVDVLLHGRRSGPAGSPVAFETKLGWVLAGETEPCASTNHIVTYHASLISEDDVLCKFWEIEEKPLSDSALSLEERTVVHHFRDNHSRTDSGRFVVSLPIENQMQGQ